MTLIIPIGDGCLVEYTEGALRIPEPEPPPKKAWTRKRDKHIERIRKPGVKPTAALEVAASIPGFYQWLSKNATAICSLKGSNGRKIGQASGYSRERAESAWKSARIKARRDMENIEKKIDLNEASREALEATLATMRSPMSQQVKLAAAKLVLDFTMAKPVSKSEVSINAAEQWLAEIAKDENE